MGWLAISNRCWQLPTSVSSHPSLTYEGNAYSGFSAIRSFRHLRLRCESIYFHGPVSAHASYHSEGHPAYACTRSILFSVFLRERNPISTRIELASLGLAGVFWLGAFFLPRPFRLKLIHLSPVLGVFLATSEAQDADVECFESPDSQVVLDDEIASCAYSTMHSIPRHPRANRPLPSRQSTPTNSRLCTAF